MQGSIQFIKNRYGFDAKITINGGQVDINGKTIKITDPKRMLIIQSLRKFEELVEELHKIQSL